MFLAVVPWALAPKRALLNTVIQCYVMLVYFSADQLINMVFDCMNAIVIL